MPVSLDILIGFAVVMLVLSLVATSIIQVLLALFQMRGRHLRSGIHSLLQQIDPDLDSKLAHTIAHAVVRHPMLAPGRFQLGGIVQREELVQLLLGFAAGTEPSELESKAKDRLVRLLKEQGIADPAATLRNIRTAAMHMEAARPDLAAHMRQTFATIGEASSEFVAGVNAWFDGTMARVTQTFAANVHLLTVIVAAILALVLEVDSFQVLNRLSVDKDLRASLVKMAIEETASPRAALVVPVKAATDSSRSGGTSRAAGADSSASAASRSDSLAFAELKTSTADLQRLATTQLFTLPTSKTLWDANKGSRIWEHLGGILLSVVLLSLGAPFWFNSLKYLVNLRSTLAKGEDQQRAQRASGGDDSATGKPRAPSSAGPGEMGDLRASG